jgi:two-component system sensor histidine kinase BaeS
VADTGPRIAPEHLPRIFDRFYRADSSRSRNGGGTGLGLSIARDLARAQGGDLTAENAKSDGAVFRLRLPTRGD